MNAPLPDFPRLRAAAVVAALCLFSAPFAAAQDDDLPRLPRRVVVAEQLAGHLVRVDAEGALAPCELDSETAIGHFLFYYSAGWNPTCRKFTPALIQFYEERRAAGDAFEIVFVSLDDSEEEMRAYMAETKMPWPAVKFGTVQIGPLPGVEAADDTPDPELADGPLKFLAQAAGRGVPSVVAMDDRGLIVAHSYKRRRDYVGPEEPLEEFAEILADAAAERAEAEPQPDPAPGGGAENGDEVDAGEAEGADE